jgi:hypothetical protein
MIVEVELIQRIQLFVFFVKLNKPEEMADDLKYENQINTVNELGNSLLANLFMLKNVQNRKLANISNVLSKSSKQIERYVSEKEKLQ